MIESASSQPVEWFDRNSDIWREHPADPHRLKIVRAAGHPVAQADYHARAYVRSQFGELTRVELSAPSASSASVDPTTAPPTEWTDNGGSTWEDAGDGLVRVVAHEGVRLFKPGNPLPIAHVQRTWGPLTPHVTLTTFDTTIINAAEALEDLLVMTTQAVQDLRDIDANPAVDPPAYAAPSHRAVAYTRLYFLQRELGRIVATLGADAPIPAVMRAVEADYRSQIEE